MKLTPFLHTRTCLMTAAQDNGLPAAAAAAAAADAAAVTAAASAAGSVADLSEPDWSEDQERPLSDLCLLSQPMIESLEAVRASWEQSRSEQALDACAGNLTSELIAFAGMRCVLDFLPGSREEYLSDRGGNSGLDIVVMVNLKEEYIRLICDRLAAMGAESYSSMTQEQRLTAPEISGWSDSDRARCICLAVNSRNITSGSDDLPWLCELSATDARNTTAVGRKLLCAALSTENTDTLGHKNCRIDNKALMRSIVNNTFAFIQAKAAELKIAIADSKNDENIITQVLNELDRSDYVSNPYHLARYACAVISGLQSVGSTASLEQIIGQSLQVLSFPADSNMFSKTGKKSQSWHGSTAAAVLRNRSSFKEGRDSKGEDLDFQAMAENYLNNFWRRKEDRERLTDGGHALIRNWLAALHARDSDALTRAFELLCTLEWEDVLENLLGSSERRQSSQKLWAQTANLIRDNITDESENITAAEEAEIKPLANAGIKSLSDEDKEKLENFYLAHRNHIQTDSRIDKDWQKRIYNIQSATDDNFMLSLARLLMLNFPCQDGTYIERITLKLNLTSNQIRNLNEHAGHYFSMRFGPYLRRLKKELGDLFVISLPFRTADSATGASAGAVGAIDADAEAGSQELPDPLTDFGAFIAARPVKRKGKGKSSAKKGSTPDNEIKFFLIVKLSNSTREEKHSFSWKMDKSVPVHLSTDLSCLTRSKSARLLRGTYRQRIFGQTEDEILSMTLKNKSTLPGSSSMFSGAYAVDLSRQAQDLFEEISGRAADADSALTEKIAAVKEQWEAFTSEYMACLKIMNSCQLRYEHAHALSVSYALLQHSIHEVIADSSTLRSCIDPLHNLLRVLLQVGMAYPEGSDGLSAVATPFTVESMRGFTARMERLCDLIVSKVRNSSSAWQARRCMDILAAEINSPDAPDLCALRDDQRGQLLVASEYTSGYTVYRPLRAAYAMSWSGASVMPAGSSAPVPPSVCTDEVISFIDSYVKGRPFAPELFTVMVRDCPDIELAELLYQRLRDFKGLKGTRFHLLFVSDIRYSQKIYSCFEMLRSSRQLHGIISSDRVQVSVLPVVNSDDATGTYSCFFNRNALESGLISAQSTMSGYDMSRIADLGLLFYSFDARARTDFVRTRLPAIVDNSTVAASSVSRNIFDQSSEARVRRCAVSNVLTAERIRLCNSLALLSENQVSLDECRRLDHHIRAHATAGTGGAGSGGSGGDNELFEVVLPFMSIKDPDENLLEEVHNKAEVAAFIDELPCRSILRQKDRHLVYYRHLRNHNVHFLVSSTAERAWTSHWLQDLYASLYPDAHGDMLRARDFVDVIRLRAADISGSILLRAENRWKNTMEMAGTVMARFICEPVLRQHAAKYGHTMALEPVEAMDHPVFLSLDDYAHIFALNGQQRADILALQIFRLPGTTAASDAAGAGAAVSSAAGAQAVPVRRLQYLLAVQVIESKFLSQNDPEARKKSIRQASETANMFYSAFEKGTADRMQLLTRLTSMIADNCNARSSALSDSLKQVIHEINRGHVLVDVSGISAVCECNSDAGHNTSTARVESGHKDSAFEVLQIVLSRSDVKKIFSDLCQWHRDTGGHPESGRSFELPDFELTMPDDSIDRLSSLGSHYTIKNHPAIDLSVPLTPGASAAAAATAAAAAAARASATASADADDSKAGSASATVTATPSVTDRTAAAESNSSVTHNDLEPELNPGYRADTADGSGTCSGTGADACSGHYGHDVPGRNDTVMEITDDLSGGQNELRAGMLSEQDNGPESGLSAVGMGGSEPGVQAQFIGLQNHAYNQLSGATLSAASLNEDLTGLHNEQLERLRRQGLSSGDGTSGSAGAGAGTGINDIDLDPGVGPQSGSGDGGVMDFDPDPAAPGKTRAQANLEAVLRAKENSSVVIPPLAPRFEEKQPAADNGSGQAGHGHGDDHDAGGAAQGAAELLSEPERQALVRFWSEHPLIDDYVRRVEQDVTVELDGLERQEGLNHAVAALVECMHKAGLPADVMGSTLTPNGACVRLSGHDDLSSRRILELSEKLYTGDAGIKLIAVRSVQHAYELNISWPGNERRPVPYLSLLRSRRLNVDNFRWQGHTYTGFNSCYLIGLSDNDGAPVYLDLRGISPHTLIGGATKSGKSTLLNALIMDMVLTNTPEELQLYLVDPKGGAELDDFADLPHTRSVLVSPAEYGPAFSHIIDEMESRLKLMRSLTMEIKKQQGSCSSIRDIDEYNSQACEHGRNRMPRIVLVIDEFAEITSGEMAKAFEDMLTRLSNKARAAGIHLLLCTQRPDSKVMNGRIKSNVGNRICLKVNGQHDTGIILSSSDYDARTLMGYGHMIACVDSRDGVIAQSPFIDRRTATDLIALITREYQLRQQATR